MLSKAIMLVVLIAAVAVTVLATAPSPPSEDELDLTVLAGAVEEEPVDPESPPDEVYDLVIDGARSEKNNKWAEIERTLPVKAREMRVTLMLDSIRGNNDFSFWWGRTTTESLTAHFQAD